MKLRGQEVLLPTTHVGSYPRPIFMQGKVFDVGIDAPEFPSFRMRELYRHAVSSVIHDQERAGLDIVTDGGQHYENETDYELAELFHYTQHRLKGVKPYGDRIQVGVYDMPIWKPTVADELEWYRPIWKPVIEAAKDATDKPIKINVGLGPLTQALLCTNAHYPDLPSLAMAWAKALNREYKDMAERGCEQIQFAEAYPIVFALLDPADWMLDVINTALEDTGLYTVVHMCYGHEEGQNAVPDSGSMVSKIFPWAFGINANQLHIEMASHNFEDTKALSEWPSDKDLGIGVINVKSLVVEPVNQIADWIRQTIAVVPPERVCLSTDCSIASVRGIVARKKLAAMVAARDIVRSELTGTK
jgi:5-methyltetrahydropteroyltriglutamate--homocysteine methyltransferase